MHVNPTGSIETHDVQKVQKNISEGKAFHQTLGPLVDGSDTRFDSLFLQAGEQWNVPPRLLKAMARAESNFNPRAVSHAGAQGMMQLMPETGRSLGVRDPFDPEENIGAAAKYMRSLLDRYDGDVKLALAAYNAGPGNVEKYQGIPPFKETQKYVAKILGSLDGDRVQMRNDSAPDSMRPDLAQEAFGDKMKAVGIVSPELLKFWVDLKLMRAVLSAEEKRNQEV
ncbi:lytic transglycosylase domain-containing protein [Candidatus Formimonas warabiya]|uniref:Transglycosylase SLT domain-containing protein n=1 Tax=Formimonas warabiya TaxID=1761012 RepID=A0A3G1KZW7_FORW1|nr:lytic transglycosylase domain-containing protein [Candidatus Formimonas warabiya]ATW27960.1 hypothetical protein DCMF_27255 [Candidatus Formimonas warabiya]